VSSFARMRALNALPSDYLFEGAHATKIPLLLFFEGMLMVIF